MCGERVEYNYGIIDVIQIHHDTQIKCKPNCLSLGFVLVQTNWTVLCVKRLFYLGISDFW